MYDFFFVLVPQHYSFLLQGALVTLELSIISMACGIVLGMAVALARLTGRRAVEWPLNAYVEIWRAVPLIVQLMVIYFTLPEIGIRLPGFWAGVLGLTLNLAAYLSEVFRAAILSIDDGQRLAGVSIGMSQLRVYWRIVLPQAFRIAVPTVGGYFIALLKDSSLVSFIAVNDLMRHGMIIIANTFQSMQVYFMVAIIYCVMSLIAARIVNWIEMSFTPPHRRRRRRNPSIGALAPGL
jgi:His/Glu/Gln/Arg/opine family amino acid ABC transporter permease subunit